MSKVQACRVAGLCQIAEPREVGLEGQVLDRLEGQVFDRLEGRVLDHLRPMCFDRVNLDVSQSLHLPGLQRPSGSRSTTRLIAIPVFLAPPGRRET